VIMDNSLDYTILFANYTDRKFEKISNTIIRIFDSTNPAKITPLSLLGLIAFSILLFTNLQSNPAKKSFLSCAF